MKNPDKVFKELGQLYDFYKEIAKFHLRKRKAGKMGEPGKIRNPIDQRPA